MEIIKEKQCNSWWRVAMHSINRDGFKQILHTIFWPFCFSLSSWIITLTGRSFQIISILFPSNSFTINSFFLQVSVIDMEGPTLLYQNHIASEIRTGVISLQFQTCRLHGFEKNVLVVATMDSSVLALDSDTGNTLNTNRVRPKKPSKALFMQILGECYWLQVSTWQDNQ